MEVPPPAPWTYAARAAYFGDRVCPFCDHHNPAGAKYCNECSSPLYLKPCHQCDAINHLAATHCHKCGAECPALLTTPGATRVLPAAGVTTPARAAPGDAAVASNLAQRLFAAGAARARWRMAGIATILIAGAYAAYHINVAAPDTMGVASQSIGPGEHSAPAVPVVPVGVESKPVEPEATAALQAPIPNTNLEAPKGASTHQRPVPVPATKRTSTHQHPLPDVPVRVGAIPPVAQTHATAHVDAAKTSTARQPDPWEAMRVSLAGCDGDLISRILCDQRVRRHFCEGHWGEAPECGRIANDHGQ